LLNISFLKEKDSIKTQDFYHFVDLVKYYIEKPSKIFIVLHLYKNLNLIFDDLILVKHPQNFLKFYIILGEMLAI
jgi:hypothetical protein